MSVFNTPDRTPVPPKRANTIPDRQPGQPAPSVGPYVPATTTPYASRTSNLADRQFDGWDQDYLAAIAELERELAAGTDQPLSPWDMLQATLTAAGRQPVSGPSGGGSRGGGGSLGPSADTSAAYRAYLASVQGQDIGGRFDELRGRLGSQFSDDPVNARYDRFSGSIQDASAAGSERVAGIGAESAARAAQGRTATSEAFSDGDSRLRALQQQFSAGSQGNAAGLNNILNSFDAGSVQAQQAPINNLFAAARAAQLGAATSFDAAGADREALSGALVGDVQTGISQGEQALMARIAAQRDAGLQQNDASRAQLDAELFMQQQQAEQARLDQENQIRLQMAQLGIGV